MTGAVDDFESQSRSSGALCTSCGAASMPLSAAQQCRGCSDAATRRRIATEELRTWKRYSPGTFR